MKPGELERSIARLAAVARSAQGHLAAASRELARLALPTNSAASAGTPGTPGPGDEPNERGVRADHPPTEATFK